MTFSPAYETNSTQLTIKLDQKKKKPKNKTENGFQMLNKKQGQTTVSRRRGAYMATVALRLRPSVPLGVLTGAQQRALPKCEAKESSKQSRWLESEKQSPRETELRAMVFSETLTDDWTARIRKMQTDHLNLTRQLTALGLRDLKRYKRPNNVVGWWGSSLDTVQTRS